MSLGRSFDTQSREEEPEFSSSEDLQVLKIFQSFPKLKVEAVKIEEVQLLKLSTVAV